MKRSKLGCEKIFNSFKKTFPFKNFLTNLRKLYEGFVKNFMD